MGLRSLLSRLRKWFRSAPPPAPRRSRPRLEALEVRDVPTVAVTQAYLAGLYQGFLGRAIDTNGLTFWNQVLATTGSRVSVAEGIVHSQEYHGRELQLLYGTYLHRQLDPTGLAFWGNVLETGGTYEQVKAGILGSQEYFNDQGGIFTNWLTAVYTSQLGRSPSPADTAFWNSQFTSAASLPAITSQILASHEFHTAEMNAVYPLILGRPLDSAGFNFWVPVLDSGVSVDDVAANVVGSQEFFNNLIQYTGANNFSDINQAANGFFTQLGLFNRVLPAVEQLNRFIPTDPTIRTSPATTAITVGPFSAPLTVGNASPTTLTSNVGAITGAGSATITGAGTGTFTGAGIGAITGAGSGAVTGGGAGAITTGGSNTITGGGAGALTGTNTSTLTRGGSGTITGSGSGALTGLNAAMSSFFV